jgi:predicted nucleic acid-binding protein
MGHVRLDAVGFVRLSSNPAAIAGAKTPAEAATLLARMVADPLHTYLGTLPSPLAKHLSVGFHRVMGFRQITDAYLLALARVHGATFLTFDTRLESLAEPGTPVRMLG